MFLLFLAQAIQETPVIEPGDFGAAFAKMLLSLVILVTFLCLTVWLMRRLIQRRLQKGNSTQAIQVLERKMISPKTTLYLVEVEEKTRIIIAESQLEIKKIETLESIPPSS